MMGKSVVNAPPINAKGEVVVVVDSKSGSCDVIINDCVALTLLTPHVECIDAYQVKIMEPRLNYDVSLVIKAQCPIQVIRL